MSKLWTKRNVAIYVGGIVVGSAVAHFVPGDMVTKVLITFPILLVVMIVGIYLLNKQAASKEAH